MKNISFLLLFFLNTLLMLGQQWEWATQGTATGDQAAKNITVDDFGNCFVVAQIKTVEQMGTSTVNPGNVIVKYNPQGKILFAWNIPFLPVDLETDNSGNLYLLGTFTMNILTPSGNITSKGKQDLLITKTDPNGNEIWARSFGSNEFDHGTGIVIDKTGNCYLAGSFYGDTLDLGNKLLVGNLNYVNYSGKFFIASLASDGATNWVKDGYQTPTTYINNVKGITLNKNSDIYVLVNGNGSGIYDWEVVKYSPAGDILSNQVMVVVTPNGFWNPTYSNIMVDDTFNIYVYVNGYRYNYGGIIKYDKDMNSKWSFSLGYSSSCLYYYDYNIDERGNLYLCGITTPQGGYCSGTTNTSYDIFVRKLDGSGKIAMDVKVAGNGDEIANAIAIDKSGNCYITGIFNYKSTQGNNLVNQPTTFDNSNLQSNSQFSEIFTAKLGSGYSVGLPHIPAEHAAIKVFPNPCDGRFTIECSSKLDGVKVNNVIGETVLEQHEISSAHTYLNMENYPSGIYFVEISTNKTKQVTKIIVR